MARRPKRLPYYLTFEQAEAMAAAAWWQPVDRLLVLLGWRAGLRVSESLAVTLADVTITSRERFLRVTGKGHRERLVPLHRDLVDQLEGARAAGVPRSVPLIAMDRTTAWRHIKMLARRAGHGIDADKVGTHTLRHSAARHWLREGRPMNQVSLWLGHLDEKTTWIYSRLAQDDVGDMEGVA